MRKLACVMLLALGACGGVDQETGADMAQPAPKADMARELEHDLATAPDLAEPVEADMADPVVLDMTDAPSPDLAEAAPSPDLAPVCPFVPTCKVPSDCCNGAGCIDETCWNAPGDPCDDVAGPACWHTATYLTYCGTDHRCHHDGA